MLALFAVCLSVAALAASAPVVADSHLAIEEDAVEQAHGDVAEFMLSVPQGSRSPPSWTDPAAVGN
ncbi:hypothetical protein ACFQL4_00760 [Halosimplex aquaticum]